jgi:proteasome activator subunit 4
VVNPYAAGTGTPAVKSVAAAGLLVKPGERPDNMFLQYADRYRPRTAVDYDAPRYIHKTYVGFYVWPQQRVLYAPSCAQPTLDRAPADMTDLELLIHSFFTEPDKVAKFFTFLTLEDKKGRDRFSVDRFGLFKALFRNFGDSFLDQFRKAVEEWVGDGRESYQRAAAELVAALVRGSKHWPFHKVEELWAWLIPAIRTALANVAPETMYVFGGFLF